MGAHGTTPGAAHTAALCQTLSVFTWHNKLLLVFCMSCSMQKEKVIPKTYSSPNGRICHEMLKAVQYITQPKKNIQVTTMRNPSHYMGVAPKIGVPPKSSILIRFSIINHPFWGTPISIINHLNKVFHYNTW